MQRTIKYQAGDGLWYDLVVYDLIMPEYDRLETENKKLKIKIKEQAEFINIQNYHLGPDNSKY